MGKLPVFQRLSDYVEYHAEHTPDATALVLGLQRTSYARLADQIARLAKAMLATGVEPGDRVAVLQNPTPDYFVSFIAAASIGAIWVGLNPKYRLEELRHIVTDSRPRLLMVRSQIGDRDYSADIAVLRESAAIPHVVGFDSGDAEANIVSIDDFIASGAAVSQDVLEQRRSQAGGRVACLLVYTSGTTGTPKGALLHQQAIIDFSLAQNRLWPLDDCRMVNFFPINHIGSTIDLASPCMIAGGTTIFMEQFDAARSLDVMAAEKVTLWIATPSVFALQLAELDRRARDLSAVKLIVWEGSAITPEIFDRLAAICPAMATNYGMTESTSAITATPPSHDREALLGSVGPAFEGVEVLIADSAGNPVADGVTGEILARSPNNFLGYWNLPDASREAFTRDAFLKTGDLGVKLPDGSFRIVGRIKEMFKSGAYNVYPREVEGAIEDHPAVEQAVVVAVPDPAWQEVGVAFVKLTPGVEIDGGTLLTWLKQRLANYKVPKHLSIEAELPLLPIGKIDRVALRKRAARDYEKR